VVISIIEHKNIVLCELLNFNEADMIQISTSPGNNIKVFYIKHNFTLLLQGSKFQNFLQLQTIKPLMVEFFDFNINNPIKC
jgi:hypothetical protein